jgi:hypothetical protein
MFDEPPVVQKAGVMGGDGPDKATSSQISKEALL